MKALCLTTLALFGLAAATAGPPARNNPRAYTHDDLENDLKAAYKLDRVESTSEGETKWFHVKKIDYEMENGKEKVSWGISVAVKRRAGYGDSVRILFPCQKLPANPDPTRLLDLMSFSGSFEKCGAYFQIGGKERMLYLASDVSVERLNADDLHREVYFLMLAADRTRPLWTGDLSKPTAKMGTPANSDPKAAPTEKSGVTGEWHRYPKSERGTPHPFVDGIDSVTFAEGGTYQAKYYTGNSNAAIQLTQTGTYTVKDDLLTVTPKGSKVAERFTLERTDDKITVTPQKGDQPHTFAAKKITLHR